MYSYSYNEFILTVIIVLQFIFIYFIIKLLVYFIINLLFYLLLISLAFELGFLEALFNYIFIIIQHFVFTCKFKLIMNISNIYVLQCILCASERNVFPDIRRFTKKYYYYLVD